MSALGDSPAFPRAASLSPSGLTHTEGHHAHVGMTLRQYYKTQALVGLLAATSHESDWPNPKRTAAKAAEFADAILTEDEEHGKK